MKIQAYILLIPLAFSLISSNKSHQSQPRKRVQVYLLLGQSNMAGRGEITDQYKGVINERVITLTKDMKWMPAQHPLHFDKPKAAGVGPGLAFGEDLAMANKNDTIALVPCAVGGTSINLWTPSAYDKATDTRPYDDALECIRFASSKGEIKGVIWLQGESDSSSDFKIKTYLDKLAGLIGLIRTETKNPNLPWVCGELGRYRNNYQKFNAELNKLPSKVETTAVVTSEELTHKGDTIHFNSESATLYGHRFAKAMMKLLDSK